MIFWWNTNQKLQAEVWFTVNAIHHLILKNNLVGGGGDEVEWHRKMYLWQQSIQSYILHLLKALQHEPLSLASESQQIELYVSILPQENKLVTSNALHIM